MTTPKVTRVELIKPIVVKLLNPLHVAFEFKISRNRLKELREMGSFPEPDYLRPIGEGGAKVPYWKRETVSQFLIDYPEEDNRRSYHYALE
jgi:hypothetical protein